MKILDLIVISLCFVGCSSNKNTSFQGNFCQVTDWHSQGKFDAASGKSVRRYDVYKKQCGELLSSNSLQRYQQGYITGLELYCTYERGFAIGESGALYESICPIEKRERFLVGFERGKEVYAEKKRIFEKAKREQERLFQQTGESEGAYPDGSAEGR